MAVQSYSLNLGLNDVPDDSIEPEVWRELNKVFLAVKAIADSMDSGVHPGLLGTPGEAVTIQNYSKVYRTPTVEIPAGRIVMFIADAVHLTSSTYNAPRGYAEKLIPANTIGEFTTLGMVYYPAGGLTPGARYWVDTTTGGGTITSTYAAGRQFVGQAFGTHALYFEPNTDTP